MLIYLAWKSADHWLEALSEFFQVGYTAISSARVRGGEHLKKNERPRSKVQVFLVRS